MKKQSAHKPIVRLKQLHELGHRLNNQQAQANTTSYKDEFAKYLEGAQWLFEQLDLMKAREYLLRGEAVQYEFDLRLISRFQGGDVPQKEVVLAELHNKNPGYRFRPSHQAGVINCLWTNES